MLSSGSPSPKQTLRGALLGCAATGIIATTPSAQAVGLGEILSSSGIGESFRVEIPLKISPGEQVDSSCIKLATQPANDMSDVPWVSRGQISIRQTEKGAVLIISGPPVHHPAVMLGVLVRCGVSLRRDYALLLDPPSTAASPLVSTAPSPRSGDDSATDIAKVQIKTPAATQSGQSWIVGQNETLESVARMFYPNSRAAQRRFINQALRSGQLPPGVESATDILPSGVAVEIPSTEALPALEQKRKNVERGEGKATTRSGEPRNELRQKAGTKRDRLFVSESGDSILKLTTTIGQRPEMSEVDRAKLKTELQLIAALDEKNAQHLELKEHIKQLENLRTRLQAEATRLEGELSVSQSPAAPPDVAPMIEAASDGAVPVTTKKAAQDTASSSVGAAQPEGESGNWYKNIYAMIALLVAAAGTIAAGIIFLQAKRKHSGDIQAPDATTTLAESAEVAIAAPVEGDPLMEPLTEADIWPEVPEPPSSATVKAIEGAIGPLSGAAPTSLMYADGEDEHDSAVELADIMMSFGRMQGAAQTLSDFIRANPKQAVKPWVKLLEVYRAANMRMEFEALTAQMNKTFNVQPVLWDDFDVALRAPESLENMEHIRNRLCELWGQRQCQAYLHELLRDNRQGTRQGFPLAIVDEVLLLLAILDARLGPYKPVNNTQDPDLTKTNASEAVPTTLPIPAKASASTSDMLEPLPLLPAISSVPSLTKSLDFDLIDMDMLSKTLHINLDELTEPPPPEEIGK